jgi:hypothetical protein
VVLFVGITLILKILVVKLERCKVGFISFFIRHVIAKNEAIAAYANQMDKILWVKQEKLKGCMVSPSGNDSVKLAKFSKLRKFDVLEINVSCP